ncbi:replication factor A protein 1-like isoform X2 [Phragmites australis]|uniref:replication factor A protein 1-like isoform X2 n=1 Tax=Phragmites australis TaxID=29695 RepID=UPI002D792686|nr:replication factor A protein 1-like isoform X2 [Phragmites australis]
MPFDLFPTLHPKSKHWVICARASRKWEYRGGTDDGPIVHVDLVLGDEKGNAIYAEIPSSEIDTKSPLIQEGGIYIISRFRVSKAKSLYRPVDGPYMVEFTCYTKITPAKDVPQTFPTHIYKLTPFTDLRRHIGENRNFLDVLGIITEVSDTRSVQLPNQPTPTLNRNIVLKDLSNLEIRLTLWGQRAAEFTIDAIYNEEQPEPIIILVVGTLMKSYSGEEYLSGNTACRWYFNPAILEAEHFYTVLRNQRLPIKHTTASTDQTAPMRTSLPLEDKHLNDLQAMDPYDFPDGGCQCTITITRLVLTTPWWFPSCNRCSRACILDGDGYRCNTCSCTGYRFKPLHLHWTTMKHHRRKLHPRMMLLHLNTLLLRRGYSKIQWILQRIVALRRKLKMTLPKQHPAHHSPSQSSKLLPNNLQVEPQKCLTSNLLMLKKTNSEGNQNNRHILILKHTLSFATRNSLVLLLFCCSLLLEL